jgi:hypothetical protein
MLNPDVEVAADFGKELVEVFDRDRRLGAAGALLYYPDGATVQHAGGEIAFPTMWSRHRGQHREAAGFAEREADVDYVAGGAMGVRMTAAREVDGFDERFYPAFYEDVDFCFRLREAGWAVRFFPRLTAIHHEGATLGQSPLRHHYSQANRIRFALKHLSGIEWRRDFVPAEVANLRHALSEAAGEDWPESSGLSGIEAALRNPDAPHAGTPVTDMHAALLPGVHEALEAARVAATLPERSGAAKSGVAGRVQEGLAAGKRLQWAEDALLRQAEFNRAIVAALDAQDKLNREQLALVLTLALDMLQFLPVTRPPSSGPMHPPAEISDES